MENHDPHVLQHAVQYTRQMPLQIALQRIILGCSQCSQGLCRRLWRPCCRCGFCHREQASLPSRWRPQHAVACRQTASYALAPQVGIGRDPRQILQLLFLSDCDARQLIPRASRAPTSHSQRCILDVAWRRLAALWPAADSSLHHSVPVAPAVPGSCTAGMASSAGPALQPSSAD